MLSALGIAIGVAAIVAVLGLAASSSATLLEEIQALGTNLLTVTNGQNLSGATAELPVTAPGMIARLPGVTAVQDTGKVNGVNAYRSPLIPAIETNALSVAAASLGLPAVAGTSIAQGRFLNAATAREPVAVLGAQAAQLLGIDRVLPGERIWLCARPPAPPAASGSTSPASSTRSALRSRDRHRGPGRLSRRRALPRPRRPPLGDLRPHHPDNQAVTTAVDSLLGAQANPENPG